MKVIYYDLGSYRGEEIDNMLAIFNDLNIVNFAIYGFEPCKKSYDLLVDKYCSISQVYMVNAAISDKNSNDSFLYYAPNEDGHSIFKSKTNVYSSHDPNSDKKERVTTVLFSDWIRDNISEFKNSLNILKTNIEGAEWFLFNDIVNNGLLEHFKIICGDAWDVKKIGELSGLLDCYSKIIKDNNIVVHDFSGQGRKTPTEDIKWMKNEILKAIK